MEIKHVVCAVIIENNKVFSTQRGYGEYKDKWEFPGGKLEAGETPEEALIREIQEELATEIEVTEHLGIAGGDYGTFELQMDRFLCKVKSGNLDLLEHESARWLTKEELYEVDWLPADEFIVTNMVEPLLRPSIIF